MNTHQLPAQTAAEINLRSDKITLSEIRQLIRFVNKSYATYLQNVLDKAQEHCDSQPESPENNLENIQFEMFADGIIHPFGEVETIVTHVGESDAAPIYSRNYPYDAIV